MSNMREIKLRMKSINETRQITEAMRLISASKLRKARQQMEEMLPYFNKIKSTITDILVHSGDLKSRYLENDTGSEKARKGYLIITGDKGLAGGYNHNILKAAEEMLEKEENPLLFVIGHIGISHFVRKGYDLFENFDYPVQNPTIYRAREISEIVFEQYNKGLISELYIIYTFMVSPMKAEPRSMRLLPVNLDDLREEHGVSNLEKEYADSEMNYEPSPNAVFDILIPKYTKGIIYGALVEAFTSEQNSRMLSMDNATANADEMLHKLSIYYNRARQAAITQEISEIVSGAELMRS